MVADSTLAGRFVRRALDQPMADCDGRARPPAPSEDPASVRIVELDPTPDPRDALDRNEVDLLVSRDPRVEEYARRLPGIRVFPLPWDLTYVLVAPSPGDPPAGGDRSALVRDAVSADARGAEPPFWWTAPGACVATRPSREPAAAIRFPSHDPIARGLAERFVALLSLGTAPPWLAQVVGPVGRSGVRALPASGSTPSAGLVVPYPRAAPSICDSTRWSGSAVPLIDSRAFVVVRSNVPPFEILADGSIHFLPAAPR
jgi:hypothetical protein